MKKKNLVILIIILAMVLLIPIPLHLKDGGSVEYKALLYSITKYHQLDHNSETGYRDGIGIKILGMEIYNNLEDYNSGLAQTTSKEKVYIKMENILNINLLDDFLDNTNKYNKNAISDKVEIVTYTIEGDEILTTVEYNKETNEFTVIKDNTKDEFANEENRKITTNIYSRFNYDLIKKIKDDYIYVMLQANNNEYPDISICVYNKNIEKNKETNRTKLKDANLTDKLTSTTELISYNGVLYGKSFAVIDYASSGEPTAVINRLIGEEYVPNLNGETNTEKLLNAAIDYVDEKTMVLLCDDVYILFNAIETNTSSFLAKVIESKSEYIIVEPAKGSQERKSSDKILIGLGKYNDAIYMVGTIVKVTYNGNIMETYPAKIDAISIEVKDFEIVFNERKDLEIKTIISDDETDKYSYNIFSFAGDVKININGKEYDLRDALLNNKITMEEIISKANFDLPDAVSYDDGGSIEYHYEDYTIIKCNTLDENRDVYIGVPEMTLNDIKK